MTNINELPTNVQKMIALSYDRVLQLALELCNDSRNCLVKYAKQESTVEEWTDAARRQIEERFE